MRPYVPVAVLASAVLLAGCGDDPEPRGPEPTVRLTLSGPADGAVVRDERVTVAGSVEPARARVLVLGEEVPVQAGRFEVELALDPGANLIDVAASATGRRSDFAALRVVREQRVTVPRLAGDDANAAQEQLEALGLEVELDDGGGFFDPLLPGDPAVCDSDPPPGTDVLPGATVTLIVARDC